MGKMKLLLGLITAALVTSSAQAEGPQYRVDPAWPKQLPNNWILGQIGGMTVDAQDHVWIFQRPRSLRDVDLGARKNAKCCQAAPSVMEFDGEGNVLREIRIDVPVGPDAQPAIGAIPDVAKLEAAGSPLTMAPGAPWTVCIAPGPKQVLYASDAYPGRIYKLSLEGKVLGVLGESGKQLKQFGWIHEIACPSENVLYVGELLNWRVQKLLLHP